jgi:prepilin-type processing-associated H-X9-DG protein/prepilin-type N-terminal cleavage/methylation domain-containing protein
VFISPGTSRHRLAFTLVELLVVITIIGGLVALLLPALGGSREEGRRIQCLNNIRNLAAAVRLYETSKGQLPGYSQGIRRGVSQAVGLRRDADPPRWMLVTVDLDEAAPISWAAKLLPQLDRQDIWDQLVDPGFELEIRPIDVLVCPSDDEATGTAGVPALTYSVNAGAPDWDGDFLVGDNKGDTLDNGVLLNLYGLAGLKLKSPTARLSGIRDGAATTIMFSENINKSYEPFEPGFPSRFTWAFGTEQHLGIVWVVSDRPQPGDTYVDQEGINCVGEDVYDNDPVFDPNLPRFARPASNHGTGVNVAFCDGHTAFLRDNIDYVVYQQLLTPNGKKCVDPRDHTAISGAIQTFRSASPLSEADLQ